jgi:hypothetical protein
VSRSLYEQPDDKQGYTDTEKSKDDDMPFVKRQKMTPQEGLVVIIGLITTIVIKFQNFG